MPVDVNGKLVHHIEYHKGVPILDKFALPGNTATIVLTGDRATDLRHAEDAWRNLNPGKKLPKGATFHHDLLHAAEHIEVINGKKTKVLVGKMPLIPTDIHQTVAHQGTASVAKRFYEGLGAETKDAIKQVSKHQASLAGTGKDFVAAAAKKIKPGKISKGISRLVGRTVVRAIPIIGTGLAVLEFADNVEAHGLGGAVARATPVLGDLISAHDLGSDLAKEIIDDANKNRDDHLKALNQQVAQAWKEANDQTLSAFHDLAGQIQVTNTPDYHTGHIVDPDEIADALNEYRNNMQAANHQRIAGQPGYDYRAAADRNKQQLKRALEHASQKRAAPPKQGSVL